MTEKDKIEQAANELSSANDCDVMIINGDIYPPLQDMVVQQFRNRKNKKKSLLFILATPGGVADSAYRISRAIQDNYEYATQLSPAGARALEHSVS